MGKAYFKQKCGLYAINIVAACGVFIPEQFAGLGKAAQDCGVFRLKLTSRQTVVAVLDEAKVSCLEQRLTELGLAVSPYGGAVRAVKACAGNSALCPRALGDALDLGIEIQEKFLGREVPKDVKIAVAGCPRGCTDPLCADFGVVARGGGTFNIFLGGRSGSSKPLHGSLLAGGVHKEGVFKILEHVLKQYDELALPKERLAVTAARLGFEAFSPPPGLLGDNSPQESADQDFLAFLNGKGK
ncbi:nitrite reductase [Desulfoscipio geothermicus]|uniref:Nitrite and sulphite reductase 4Fe-4S domain-containing protein n=1 Tax=Desulfoscipio geothermicus DSM 3669 TaxID=1121426 RepID=A0A1I6DK74_9FIRM|nr:nitrite reductase [Desulfoscipio geothermicus]SFR05742.1 Nitrite and sulphite reductase 4Fe-4S domain-containing protein [Desulfoscipio geothermicus DSM 3669]